MILGAGRERGDQKKEESGAARKRWRKKISSWYKAKEIKLWDPWEKRGTKKNWGRNKGNAGWGERSFVNTRRIKREQGGSVRRREV